MTLMLHHRYQINIYVTKNKLSRRFAWKKFKNELKLVFYPKDKHYINFFRELWKYIFNKAIIHIVSRFKVCIVSYLQI